MLQTLNIEFARLQLHGSDSSLFLMREADTQWTELVEIETDFIVTRQRDVAQGGMIDRLTVNLSTDEQKLAFNKTDGVELRLGANRYRYASENKAKVPIQTGSIIGYADLRPIFNDATIVEAL